MPFEYDLQPAGAPPVVGPSVDDLLSREEATSLLRLGSTTLRNWATRGIGPRYMRIGHRVVYRRGDLIDFALDHVVDPGGDAA